MAKLLFADPAKPTMAEIVQVLQAHDDNFDMLTNLEIRKRLGALRTDVDALKARTGVTAADVDRKIATAIGNLPTPPAAGLSEAQVDAKIAATRLATREREVREPAGEGDFMERLWKHNRGVIIAVAVLLAIVWAMITFSPRRDSAPQSGPGITNTTPKSGDEEGGKGDKKENIKDRMNKALGK